MVGPRPATDAVAGFQNYGTHAFAVQFSRGDESSESGTNYDNVSLFGHW
jgi:hypothetical protein